MDGEQERPKNQTIIADEQKEGMRTALANKLHFFFRSKAVCCDLRSEVLHLAVELDTKKSIRPSSPSLSKTVKLQIGV